MMCFERMSQFQIRSNAVGVPATDAGDFCKSGGHEFGDDFLDHTLGNADANSDLAKCGVGVAVEAQQDVHVVGKEGPAGGFSEQYVTGYVGFLQFRRLSRFFHELSLAKTNKRTTICEIYFVCFVSCCGASMLEVLRANFCSPLTLAFAFGMFARVIRSELALPRDLYASLSFYLLFAIGLKGGIELSQSNPAALALPALVTLLISCITPLTSWIVLRRIGGLSISDAAGIAAHYGSVSAVTFVAAQQFAASRGLDVEGYMPALLALLEIPGIQIAIAVGLFQLQRERNLAAAGGVHQAGLGLSEQSRGAVLHELLTGRSLLLLVGGLLIGLVAGPDGCKPVLPLFEGLFRGALTLFLLEMGLTAGGRLSDLPKVGAFLVAFGILMPIAHGCMGVWLGSLAGLSVGGCMILGTMASSASYIAAPPAVRMSLPEANPAFSLTAALAITFPFNLLFGIPLYHEVALLLV
ncbi:MAG: hypothetical protein RLZZ436_1676 [Planctomycetota bacterium]